MHTPPMNGYVNIARPAAVTDRLRGLQSQEETTAIRPRRQTQGPRRPKRTSTTSISRLW